MLFRSTTLMTTPGRAVVGLMIGSLTGAALTALYFVAEALWRGRGGGESAGVEGFGILIFVVALFVWSPGLFTLGVAGWTLLHGGGWRGPGTAALFGAGLTPLIARGLSNGPLESGFVWLALGGAVVGLVIWRVSYRRQPDAGR